MEKNRGVAPTWSYSSYDKTIGVFQKHKHLARLYVCWHQQLVMLQATNSSQFVLEPKPKVEVDGCTRFSLSLLQDQPQQAVCRKRVWVCLILSFASSWCCKEKDKWTHYDKTELNTSHYQSSEKQGSEGDSTYPS